MSNSKEDIKQKRWQELKASVGSAVHQTGKGMTLDELLLNVKNVGFDTLVSQTSIQTDADKAHYLVKGYSIELTEAEFRERFNVDPGCVWYTPSLSAGCLYFNKDTLAVSPFPIDFILHGIYKDASALDRAVALCEKEASNNEYVHALLSLPDAMRMEYFNLLVEKKGADIPGLYGLFCMYYTESDYGFGSIKPSTLDVIFSAKSEEEKEKTKEALLDLPDSVRIYRGGNTASVPYDKACSWTLDINVANFFACRRGTGEGYIVEAEVNKDAILEAFLDERNEQEVCVRPSDVTVLQEIPVKGVNFVKDVLPKIAPMYHEYMDKLERIPFAQESAAHGVEHEARVLLNALTIAYCMDMPLCDRRILAEAAIYHDTRRDNDIEDSEHGKAAKDHYRAAAASPDLLVGFLCEYHCLPDEQGYAAIWGDKRLGKSRSRSKQLLDVFKDADALDRVRFGLRDLDLNQLRLPVSKELTLVARMYLDQIKVPFKARIVKPELSSIIAKAEVRSAETGAGVPRKDIGR